MKPILAVFIAFSILVTSGAIADLTPIPIGAEFDSPNGIFTVRLTDERNDGSNLEVKNNQTAERRRGAAGTPLLSLQWTGDSRTIVMIEHLADGSQTALLHFNEREWQRFEIVPPGGAAGHFEVIKQDIGQASLKVTYKVTKEKANGEMSRAFTSSFNVDGATGKIYGIEQHAIDITTYRVLKYRPGK